MQSAEDWKVRTGGFECAPSADKRHPSSPQEWDVAESNIIRFHLAGTSESKARPMYVAELAHEFGEGSCEWMEREAYGVVSRQKCDGAKDDVGPEDAARLAIHRRTPPRMPNVVEEQQAA
jgi:hypothetical protein